MDALNEDEATAEIPNEAAFHTPEKAQKIPKFYIRKGREWTPSPGSKRLGKIPKVIDEAIFYEMHKLVRAEIRLLREEIVQEVQEKTNAMMEKHLSDRYATMYAKMKGDMQAQVRAELQVEQVLMRAEIRKEMQEEMQKDRAAMRAEKDKEITDLKTRLDTCRKEIDAGKKEIVTCKNKIESQKTPTATPELAKEVESLKKNMHTWATVVEGTKKQMEKVENVTKENAEWIDVTKKNKGSAGNKVDIMNATLEEEARRKARALRVRVVGWAEKGTPQEDAKNLSVKIKADKVPIVDAWRVGSLQDKGGRILLLKFVDLEKKREFLANRGALKGEKIYFDEDLTPAQLEHRRACMPKVMEARKEGKYAVYRDGRVIITERREK